MSVKNLTNNKQNEELRQKMLDAIQADDENAIAEAMCRMAEGIQSEILQEARSIAQTESADRMIMSQRGQAQLTSEERSYYKAVIENRGFTGLDVTIPPTVFNRVFEDLEKNHPILSKIDFVNTGLVTKWIVRTSEVVGATWGKVTGAIAGELSASFGEEKADMYKLTAFFPVAKDMLELGPEWLDRFVRTVLKESIQIALENAVINGTGENQPIGMIKSLSKAVLRGVHSDLDATELNDLNPDTLGAKVMAPLTNEGKRAVSEIIMVVNPVDYWEKIFGKTTVMTAGGQYIHGVLPIPGEIIQSIAMPKGKMVCGRPKDYMLLIGGADRITYSDEFKFLDDERVYATKMFANGKPKKEDSFLLFNIEGMDGTSMQMSVTKGTKK